MSEKMDNYLKRLSNMTIAAFEIEWEKVMKELNPHRKIKTDLNREPARARVIAYAQTKKETKKVFCCDKCGESLSKDNRFCPGCGRRIDWIQPIVTKKAATHKMSVS